MSGTRVAVVYLQVEAGPSRRDRYDSGNAATVRAFTTKKPEQARPGCIVVKLRIRVPGEAWQPFEPEAVIDVPADLVQHPISVEAVEPS